MAKISLTNLSSPYIASGVTTYNTNLAALSTAIENTLSRDGTSPNQMNADLDLNNYDLLNAGTIDADTFILNGETLVPADLAVTNASLLALSVLTPAANKFPYFTGTSTAALADITSAGRALLDDADSDAQLATLGGGAAGIDAFKDATASDLRDTSDVQNDSILDREFTPSSADSFPAVLRLVTERYLEPAWFHAPEASDYQIAFEKMILAAQSDSKPMIVPQGTFIVNEIELPGDVSLTGMGRKTILQAANPGGDFIRTNVVSAAYGGANPAYRYGQQFGNFKITGTANRGLALLGSVSFEIGTIWFDMTSAVNLFDSFYAFGGDVSGLYAEQSANDTVSGAMFYFRSYSGPFNIRNVYSGGTYNPYGIIIDGGTSLKFGSVVLQGHNQAFWQKANNTPIRIDHFYGENNCVDIHLGDSATSKNAIGFSVSAGIYGPTLSAHPRYSRRHAKIHIDRAYGAFFGQTQFSAFGSGLGSYGAYLNDAFMFGPVVNDVDIQLGYTYMTAGVPIDALPQIAYALNGLAGASQGRYTIRNAVSSDAGTKGPAVATKVSSYAAVLNVSKYQNAAAGDAHDRLVTLRNAVVPPAPVGKYPMAHANTTAKTVGDLVYVGTAVGGGASDDDTTYNAASAIYRCTVAGTTGTGTAPTGTGTGQVDGTVTWDYHGKLA